MKELFGLSRTDLAYACALVLLIALLAVLGLLGQPLAAMALPFLVGISLGYVLARVVASPWLPGWTQAAFVISAALALVWGTLSLTPSFANLVPEQQLIDPSVQNMGTILGRLTFGFGIVYFGEIFRRLLFPWFYPETPVEADRRSRERARGGLIVGGLLLGLIVVSGLVFGTLALVAYLTAKFMG
jgi:hypothetical protein